MKKRKKDVDFILKFAEIAKVGLEVLVTLLKL